jgi:CRISPR-associated exonuclease Cas4
MPKVLAKRPRYERLLGALFTPAPEADFDD